MVLVECVHFVAPKLTTFPCPSTNSNVLLVPLKPLYERLRVVVEGGLPWESYFKFIFKILYYNWTLIFVV